MIFLLHRILVGCSNQIGQYAWAMLHAWLVENVDAGFMNENIKERDHLLDQGMDGLRVKWILKQ